MQRGENSGCMCKDSPLWRSLNVAIDPRGGLEVSHAEAGECTRGDAEAGVDDQVGVATALVGDKPAANGEGEERDAVQGVHPLEDCPEARGSLGVQGKHNDGGRGAHTGNMVSERTTG